MGKMRRSLLSQRVYPIIAINLRGSSGPGSEQSPAILIAELATKVYPATKSMESSVAMYPSPAFNKMVNCSLRCISTLSLIAGEKVTQSGHWLTSSKVRGPVERLFSSGPFTTNASVPRVSRAEWFAGSAFLSTISG
jgi:hypothetical protein